MRLGRICILIFDEYTVPTTLTNITLPTRLATSKYIRGILVTGGTPASVTEYAINNNTLTISGYSDSSTGAAGSIAYIIA